MDYNHNLNINMSLGTNLESIFQNALEMLYTTGYPAPKRNFGPLLKRILN